MFLSNAYIRSLSAEPIQSSFVRFLEGVGLCSLASASTFIAVIRIMIKPKVKVEIHKLQDKIRQVQPDNKVSLFDIPHL